MGSTVVFLFYGSILFCLIVSARKIYRFASAPLHLKWEYYRGSTVYEAIDWWTKPSVGFFYKLKSILLDVLFLREYYRRNRSFWVWLYLFHAGAYLLILWHAWLFAAAAVMNPETASFVDLVWGHVATGLMFLGGLAILVKRIADRELSRDYPPIHYIKWVVLLITILGGFYAVYFHFGDSAPALLKYVKTQISFEDLDHKLHPPLATAAHVLLVAVWLIYFPYSHMLRLFFRYYHELRDDEVPNLPGGPIETRIRTLLGQKVSWSAPHIDSGKTWAELATSLPRDTSKEAKSK
jgi:nitrate reductase gamma subunit